MNYALMKLLGMYPMNEAGGDAGDAGGGAPAADAGAAPAATDTPAAAPAADPASLLGDAVKTGDDAKPDDQEAKPDVPETYELKAPEGIELDEAVMPQVNELLKELGLPQDKAQQVFEKLLEIDAARQPTPEQVNQYYEQQATLLNQQWGEECRKLEGLGGDNFNKSLETCSQVMVKFGTPELREFLNYSALGSHPEMFKFMHAIGSAMSQDTLEHGGTPGKGPRPIEDRLWPAKS